jgi:formiminotetrahydrofolate cyclodeaminase
VEAASPSAFGQLAVSALVERLASSAPVPGGGSASAVAGALGASLVAMVAALSADRPRYAEHADLHVAAGAAGRALASRLLALADADADAYGAYAAALKLPRDGDAAGEARSAAVRRAARWAAEVPLETVTACREVIAAAEALAGRSNVNAASDLNVAGLLADAAARGAAANVLVNLPGVADPSFAARAEAAVEADLARIAAQLAILREVVASGASRDRVSPEVAAALAALGDESSA